jgi:hypothetical protein
MATHAAAVTLMTTEVTQLPPSTPTLLRDTPVCPGAPERLQLRVVATSQPTAAKRRLADLFADAE